MNAFTPKSLSSNIQKVFPSKQKLNRFNIANIMAQNSEFISYKGFTRKIFRKTLKSCGVKIAKLKNIQDYIEAADLYNLRKRMVCEDQVRSKQEAERLNTEREALLTQVKTSTSFKALPYEIRSRVVVSIFEQPDLTDRVVKLDYDPNMHEFQDYDHRVTEVDSLTGTLSILSTLNRTIHVKVRAKSSPPVPDINPSQAATHTSGAPCFTSMLESFLKGIRDGGCTSLTVLTTTSKANCSRLCPKIHASSCSTRFATILSQLPNCTQLATLSMPISETNLFHDDESALEDFFLHGEPLRIPFLTALQKVLMGLPVLQNVCIYIPAYESSLPEERWAELWRVTTDLLRRTELQGLNGRVHVRIGMSEKDEHEYGHQEWFLPESETEDDGSEVWVAARVKVEREMLD